MIQREMVSFRTQLEIFCWDIIIKFMTSLTRYRHWVHKTIPITTRVNGTALEIIVGLMWLFFGLYVGFMLGYLGI